MEGAINLTKGGILKQLLSLSLPLIMTSFIMMAYNLTDVAWVGRIGNEAVAAVGACGIITWLLEAMSLLTKVASEVTIGSSVGRQDMKNAKAYAAHNVMISGALGIVIMLGMLLFADRIISLFLLEEHVAKMAVSYLRIVAISIPFYFLSVAFVGIFNGSGNTLIPLYVNGGGLILNIILDPLFIFVFDMGTDGAAIATMLAKLIVFVAFIYIIKVKKLLLGGFDFIMKVNGGYVKRIFKLGVPVALLNMVYAFINMILGRAASAYGGHIGLLTQTTGGQLESLSWYMSQGLSSALSSFVAQNFAVRKMDRVVKSFKFSLLLSSVVGFLTMVGFIVFGEELFALFVPDREAYIAGAEYLRISGYSQLFMMVEIVAQGMFYGLNRSLPPALISIILNYVRIPMAWIFAERMGVIGIWWAISLSSIAKGVLAIVCLWWIWRRVRRG